MKNCNKHLCALAFVMLLSMSSNAYSYENVTVGDTAQTDVTTEKIKANKDTMSKIQASMDAKDFSTAISYLNGYINAKPGKYEPYKLRGDCYYALRRYELAQRDYQRAIEIKTNEDKLSTNTKYVGAIILGADKNEQLQNAELGNLYADLMYAQKALNNPEYTLSYDNAVKYNSHIYMPAQNKGEINRINCPQKYARKLNPTGIDATINSAVSDIEKKDYHSSIFKIQNVINEYPNYYLGYYLMGVALAWVEQDNDAIKSFEKAISLNPYDFESYASLGQIYYDKSETDFSDANRQKSVQYFSKALELNKNCPTYYFYQGLNNLNSGDFNSAVLSFDNALRINENDYNSMYYRAIAQYINGNYNAVINDASKLIYKHVSNYNAVLYLRALAYAKSGQKDKALSDLNSIDDNVSDVFNADIKVTSKKDKALLTYVNYLRSKIEKAQNYNVGADDGRYNPIIKKLDGIQSYVKPYENIINSAGISQEDYKKLESFYTATLPKLLESSMYINIDDIDNQYDFIRTTFSDLGISFIPKSEDTYSFTTLKDYYKKFSSKIQNKMPENGEQMSVVTPNSVYSYKQVETQPENPEKKLLQAGETSLAQMLASDMLAKKINDGFKSPGSVYAITPQQAEQITNSPNAQFKPELPDGETVKSVPVMASQEPYEPVAKQLINQQNLEKVKGIIAEEKASQSPKNTMVFSAEQKKNTQEFKIYNAPVQTTQKKQTSIPEISEENGNIKISAKEIKSTPDVVVKHVPVAQEAPAITIRTSEKVAQTANNIQQTAQKAQQTTNAAIKKTEANAADLKQNFSNSHAPYGNSVYKGLSSAAINYVGDNKDVVELNLPANGSDLRLGADRLGFGIASNSANLSDNGLNDKLDDSVFNKNASQNSLKNILSKKEKVKEKETDMSETLSADSSGNAIIPKIDVESSEVIDIRTDKNAQKIETAEPEFSDIDEMQAEEAPVAEQPEAPKNVTEVVVPKLANSENAPSLRTVDPDAIANNILTPEENAAKKAASEKSESMLNEYERLLKEQEKREKEEALRAKEEAKAKTIELKEKAKEEKLAAKQEAQRIRAEEKAKEELLKAKAKEQKLAAKKQAQEIKKQEKAKAQALKAKAKEERLAAEQQAKAIKAEEKAALKAKAAQIKEERLIANNDSNALKQEAKNAQKAAKGTKEGFISKTKAKFNSLKKTPEQKAKQAQAQAEEKAKALAIKEEKARQKAQQQAQKDLEKAMADAKKSVNNAQQQAKGTKEGFISKTKAKFNSLKKTPEQKAQQAQLKAQKEAKALQLKQERAKAKAQKAQEEAVLKAKKAQEKAAQDAQKLAAKKQAAKYKTKSSSSKWKDFAQKLKFWKKKEQPPSSVNRYIQNAIKPKDKKKQAKPELRI